MTILAVVVLVVDVVWPEERRRQTMATSPGSA